MQSKTRDLSVLESVSATSFYQTLFGNNLVKTSVYIDRQFCDMQRLCYLSSQKLALNLSVLFNFLGLRFAYVPRTGACSACGTMASTLKDEFFTAE